MSCNILNPANGKKSELHTKFQEIFQDDQAAEIAYAKVVGPSFKRRFGDWVYNYKNPTDENLEKIGEVNAMTGEPKLFKDPATNLWYFKDKNGDRDYIDKMKFSQFEAQEVEQVTNHFLHRFVLEGGKKSFNEYTPDELEKGRITASINRSITAYEKAIQSKPNKDVLQERINLVKQNKEDFKNELISSIERLGVKVRQRITDAQGNPVTEVAEEDKGGGLNMKDSFETNSKENATVNTKIMLHQIENLEENEDGDLVPIKDGFLEVESFANFDDVWNTLNKILVDTVGYSQEEAVFDVFNLMLDKLKAYDEIKFWIKPLVNKLEHFRNSGQNEKINEFVQAFTKTHLNFLVTEVNKGNYTVINATSTNSRESQLTNRWSNNFYDKFTSENELTDAARGVLNSIYKDMAASKKKFNEKLTKLRRESTNVKSEYFQEELFEFYEDAAIEITDILKRMGVTDVYPQDIDNLVVMNGGEVKKIDTIDLLYTSLEWTMKRLADKNASLEDNGERFNMFKYQTGIFSFAKAVAMREVDMADASVLLSNGKTGYSFSNPTYVSNKINEWKSDGGEQLEKMLSKANKQNSLWIRHLLAKDKPKGEEREMEMANRLDKFQAGLDSSFKSKGKNDGVENTKITMNDQVNANISQLLNEALGGGNKSYFPTIIAADKSRRILFEGFNMETFNFSTLDDGSLYIDEKAVDIALGYFEDEYRRMQEVLRENEDDNIAKVVHYHGEDGNGLKSQIFPEFSVDGKDPKYKTLRGLLYGKEFKESKDKYEGLTDIQKDELRKHIKENIKDRVTEHTQAVSKLAGLNKKLLKHYESYSNLAGNYFMNGLISSVEYTKLFSGDPAYYKNTADLIKRIPATYTDGLQLRLKKEDDLIFNQATVEGVEVASRYVEKIRESVTDKSIADAYDRVNTTDAQAWITPRRWRFIKQRLGQWSPMHDNVYKKMMTGETLKDREMKLVAQPLKGVYFEINDNRPVYLKYSQAVLIPSMVKGTPMEALYNKMVNNPETGKPYKDGEAHKEIHEVITIDGIKAGAVTPTPINKAGTTEMLPESDIELNVVKLNNRGWKLQQDLPTKLMHDTNVGSQIQKNILEGLDMNYEYDFEGGMEGRDLLDSIHATVSKLSNLGVQEIKDEFKIDENDKMTDKSFIYKTLIDEFKDRGGNENIVEALQKGLPFDSIPQIRGKVESIFMSIMNKRITKISTYGGSFIQVSPFGLETVKKDSGIIPLSEDFVKEGALLPPRIENGKVLPGQAMIPHSQAVKLLKENGIKLAGKDMKSAMALLDPSALEMITYRIPNQGMSSNDYLQIVGVLPPGAGDSIVVYDGLPAKTGSDFDIDKLFAMQNHAIYDPETGKVTKLTEANKHLAVKKKGRRAYTNKEGKKITAVPDTMYSEAELDKMLTENKLVAQYKAVLNSPATYDAMMRSIDGSQLKDDIAGDKKKGIKGLFPAPEMSNMELFSPLTQLKIKSEYLSGKTGVGLTANQLVDHVMNQTQNVRMQKWLGIGNSRMEDVNGKQKKITFFDTETTDKHSIADNLSAFLNAYVDIAKDPYISRGNHNSITANTTFMLLRAGADLKWVNRFIGQPILRELAELTLEQQSITKDSIMLEGDDGEKFKGAPIDELLAKYALPKIPSNTSGTTVANLSSSELENNIKSDGSNRNLNYEVLKAWSFLSEQAKFFGEGVIAAKSDTAGPGGSNIDRLVNDNKIKKVKNEGVLVGYMDKFDGTMLGTYKSNSLDWVKSVIRNSELFISGTADAEIAYNKISFQTGNGKLLTNAKLGKAIDNNYYSYMMSGTSLFKNSYRNYKSIMENTPLKVMKMQQDMADDPNINSLINALEIEERNGINYIGINNRNKPTDYQNKIYRAWASLYETYYKNEDGSVNREDIHPDKKLAIDLVRYAYLSSGFQNNLAQFFTHIPHQILKDFNLSGEIRDAIRNQTMSSDDIFVDQFQRHSKEDSKIVKMLDVKKMEGNSFGFVYRPARNKSQEFGTVDPTTKGKNNRYFPKFVNGKVSNFNPQTRWTSVKNYLYEKKGFVEREDAEGKMIKVPVYVRTFELGSKDGKYRTFEYSKDTPLTKSNVDANNLTPWVQKKIDDFLDNIKLESTFSDLNGLDVNQAMIDAVETQRASNKTVVRENLTQIIEDYKIPCK